MPEVDEPQKIAIVGAEAAKFTELGMAAALAIIRGILKFRCAVVSGHCHLGGIDVWAEEVAVELRYPTMIFPPAELSWERGYKPRNFQIALACDELHVIAVDRLPDGFTGMTFDECYHCRGRKERPPHVKSGACWTANQALALGKSAHWHVVRNHA